MVIIDVPSILDSSGSNSIIVSSTRQAVRDRTALHHCPHCVNGKLHETSEAIAPIA